MNPRLISRAARLCLRGRIPESRVDALVAQANLPRDRFPRSLDEHVAEYDSIVAARDAHLDGACFGLSDWARARIEALSQDAGAAREDIAAYCARFQLDDPISARYAEMT